MTQNCNSAALPVWYGLKRTAENPGMSLPFGTDPSARPQQRGSAMRGEFARVFDSEKPLIAVSGFVKDGPVIFRDIAEMPASRHGGAPWASGEQLHS
jgi:hypothetical protein